MAGPAQLIPGRVGATVRNVLEVARFGGLETGEEPAPFEVAADGRIYRLRRYFPADATGVPIVLVPPLMLTAEVYDVSPQASAARTLRTLGVDPWVVDFGSPEHEPGGLERTLTDHVLAVSDAIDAAREATGRDVHLGGYSQGGMFCYQTAAYRRGAGISSLVTFGSPVDVRGGGLLGLPEELSVRGGEFVVEHVLRGRAVPGWMTRTSFRLMDPVGAVRQRLEFLLSLHDRESLLPREGQRRYLMGEGWIAWPGPALQEFMRQFMVSNRMLVGGFTVGDRLVTLADVDAPILTFVGETDEIAPPHAVRAIRRAAPQPEIYEVTLRAGHFGLVVGRSAQRTTWPVVAEFVKFVDGAGPLPEVARRVQADGPVSGGETAGDATGDVELLVEAGGGVARAAASTATRTLSLVRDVAQDATRQLPRLGRLASARTGGRVSLGLLFEEQARRRPDKHAFLFEDLAHTYREVSDRIDAVARGLLAAGVRAGDHVAVLMDTRPTALAVIGALNRVGAVAVVLRPGADSARELELGRASRVIVDPEHAGVAAAGRPVHVFLLQTIDRRRDSELTALELPEAAGFRPPAWYEPNPGRAGDLAFILFTGELHAPRPVRITNGRFAMAAFGTAAAGKLGERDTIYSVSPLYHASGLLTGIGGAVAGGARLAMARALDPDTFWEEARRYGVTVVPYTWAQLRSLTDGPAHPGERDHPVRLFVGSGMPVSVWRRVRERFPTTRVLEFWAAGEGEAVLANVPCEKLGSVGRPLPGTAEVALARWDVRAGALAVGEDGFAIRCADGEPGMLLSRAGSATVDISAALRNVFAKGDAWIVAGSLFRRDGAGDFWLLGPVSECVATEAGVATPEPVTAALGSIPAVDLAVAYAEQVDGARALVAAATTIGGRELPRHEIDEALATLAPHERPARVRVVDDIPTTPWHRPLPHAIAPARDGSELEEGVVGDDR
jgi:putative long chain acyl-CoA synthase